MDGAKGDDVEISVPVGTEIENGDGAHGTVDLETPGKTTVAVKGGRGGRGNRRFKTSVNRFPLLAEEGDHGETVQVRLTLKLIADVGIIGVPNAGKSSLLAAATAATPKVASYPFTTLEPALGVVDLGTDGFVMADIPGLIEGAHSGVGLGHEFLRHVERTRILVHLVEPEPIDQTDPVENYRSIREELERYDTSLIERPELLVVTKSDLPCGEEIAARLTRELSSSVLLISAVTGQGLSELVGKMLNLRQENVETFGDSR